MSRRSASFRRCAVLNIAALRPSCPQRRSSVRRSESFAKRQSQRAFEQPARGNAGDSFARKRSPSSARAASHALLPRRISTAANRSGRRVLRDGTCLGCRRRDHQWTTAAKTPIPARVAIRSMETLSVCCSRPDVRRPVGVSSPRRSYGGPRIRTVQSLSSGIGGLRDTHRRINGLCLTYGPTASTRDNARNLDGGTSTLCPTVTPVIGPRSTIDYGARTESSSGEI